MSLLGFRPSMGLISLGGEESNYSFTDLPEFALHPRACDTRALFRFLL